MDNATERRWVLYGLLAAGLIFSVVAAYTGIPAGGADNYAHYNISRWAFKYPHLFLDHWGKPVFTILTAPVAQFGLLGVRILNIFFGCLTAWYIYKLALHAKLRYAWFAVIPAIFTPIYFTMMSTAMTEVLFSAFLVISIFLFFKERYFSAAILISFIFLVRTEGLAYLLLFGVAFLVKRQYKAIPLLLSGVIFFSIVGWVWHFKDFWWLINERPYATGMESVYGSGVWYYFLVRMPRYFGYIIPVFLFSGSVMMVIHWFRSGLKLYSDSFLLIILVLGSFWGYFFMHSYLWWVGETSAGLYRVMAGISPLTGFMAVYALNDITVNKQWGRVLSVAIVVLAGFLTISSASFYKKAARRDLTADVLYRVTEWLKRPANFKHKLVIHNPYFSFSTGKDPWNLNVIQNGFSNIASPERGLPDSTLFVWDAHFSSNEGRMPLEKIMDNTDFEVVTYFKPDIPFTVLGGYDYKVVIFRKISGGMADNHAILQTIQQKEMESGVYHIELFDFEYPFTEVEMNARRLLVTDSVDEHYVYTLEGIEFGPTFRLPRSVIHDAGTHLIRLTVDVLLEEVVKENSLLMVFSVEGNGQTYHYVASDFLKQYHEHGVWTATEFVFTIPQGLKKNAVLKSYIWNINKNKVLIDNFKLEVIRQVI